LFTFILFFFFFFFFFFFALFYFLFNLFITGWFVGEKLDTSRSGACLLHSRVGDRLG
jgi:hypothetical protein